MTDGHPVHHRAHPELANPPVRLSSAELVRRDHPAGFQLSAGVPCEVGSAAHDARHDIEHGIEHRRARLARLDLLTRRPARKLRFPSGQAALRKARFVLGRKRRLAVAQRCPATIPLGARLTAASACFAVVGEYVVGYEEVVVNGEAEDLLDRPHFVFSERVAVCERGVGVFR